jgi:hypothetical protein
VGRFTAAPRSQKVGLNSKECAGAAQVPGNALCLQEQRFFLNGAIELADDCQWRSGFACAGISNEDADANVQIGPQAPERFTEFTFSKSRDNRGASARRLEYIITTGPPELFVSDIEKHCRKRIHLKRKSTNLRENWAGSSVPVSPVQMLLFPGSRLKTLSLDVHGDAGGAEELRRIGDDAIDP